VILVFEIADSGQGMKEEDVKKLFDEYSRFNAEANRATEGTGLGMSIAWKLAVMMGGAIEVESEYRSGSVFTVSLPQGKIDGGVIGEEAALSLKNFQISARQNGRADIVREYMPYGSALVVDDLETNLYVALGLMSPYGLAIDTAGSGEEALEKVRAGKSYDVIFMDHMMPGMDGLEAARRIRDLGYTGTIIALTANAISGQAERFLQNGFDDYISKPIDTRQLDRALHKWVKNKHLGEMNKMNEINEIIEVIEGETPNSGLSSEPRPSAPLSNPFPGFLVHDIPGVNTAQGIALTGGSIGLYQQVLVTFRKDVEERLPLLREIPAPETLPLFTTQVHALKSASASIGAAGLSVEAAQLEAAGKAGDLAFIEASLPGFAARLAELTQGIRTALDEDEPYPVPAENFSISATSPAISPRLHELGEALKTQNTVAIDRILEELGKDPLDSKTKQSLGQISDHVLLADFDAALETLKALVEG
jgi:CheY-like chemotaxis protein/HPt (histidine-containing phosphotransfer) domain-containing protein